MTEVDVVVDHERCMGSGACTLSAPEVFELDDQLVLAVHRPVGDHLDAVRLAVESCPTSALRLVGEGTDG